MSSAPAHEAQSSAASAMLSIGAGAQQEVMAFIEQLGVRNLMAFYGSTPAYRPVLDVEGWGDPLGTWWHDAPLKVEAGVDDDALLDHTLATARRIAAQPENAVRIDYCDLTPVLRAEAKKGTQLYLKAGAHWTSEGNRVAAEGVARCLEDKGLVHVNS